MKRAHLTSLCLSLGLLQACSPSPWVDPPALQPPRETPGARVVDPIMPDGEQASPVQREAIDARNAVARLRGFTNLGPHEQARVARAQALLDQQRYTTARELADDLAHDFARAFIPVRARAGDTLPRVAARDDVFANARLWPLLRAANPELPGDDSPLPSGTVIRVPLHPTVVEVSRALQETRGR